MRGISAVVVMILILMISISLAGMAYVASVNFFSTTKNTSEQVVNQTLVSAMAQMKVESVTNGTAESSIYIRNIGRADLTNFSVYINDLPVGVNPTTPVGGKIAPAEVKNINVTTSFPSGGTIKITSAQNAIATYTLAGVYVSSGGGPGPGPGPGSNWWDSSFSYCRNITIINTNANVLTNYSIQVNITNINYFNPDFSDLRFVNDSCNVGANAIELYHYDQRKVNSVYDEAWVKVDTTPPSSNRIISIYYGKASASDDSDITTTFLFGDDFNRADNPTVGNDWIDYAGCSAISGNTLRVTGTGSAWFCGAEHTYASQAFNGVAEGFLMKTSTLVDEGMRWDSGGSQSQASGNVPSYTVGMRASGFNYYPGTSWTYFAPASANTWYQIEARQNISDTGNADFYINGAKYSIGGSHLPFASFGITSFGFYVSSTGYVDNYYVRKYQMPEPTYSIGSEQTHG